MVPDNCEFRSSLLKSSISLDVYRLFRHLVSYRLCLHTFSVSIIKKFIVSRVVRVQNNVLKFGNFLLNCILIVLIVILDLCTFCKTSNYVSFTVCFPFIRKYRLRDFNVLKLFHWSGLFK